jgi:hypothetical protein
MLAGQIQLSTPHITRRTVIERIKQYERECVELINDETIWLAVQHTASALLAHGRPSG